MQSLPYSNFTQANITDIMPKKIFTLILDKTFKSKLKGKCLIPAKWELKELNKLLKQEQTNTKWTLILILSFTTMDNPTIMATVLLDFMIWRKQNLYNRWYKYFGNKLELQDSQVLTNDTYSVFRKYLPQTKYFISLIS